MMPMGGELKSYFSLSNRSEWLYLRKSNAANKRGG